MAEARGLDRARLLELGFELGARAPGGASQGAWFATKEGEPVVLKWSPDPASSERYAALLPALAELRARGAPVPEYVAVVSFEGGILSAQTRLPGRSEDNPAPRAVEELAAAVAAQAGLTGPPPLHESTWGAFVVQTLRRGQPDWGQQEPLRTWSPRSEKLLARARAVGASVTPDLFPSSGLVHLDLHTDNVLLEAGRLTGIIDWEGACAGDPRYDLVQFAFDLEGHAQPTWELVDVLDLPPQVLRAYLALLVLKCTSAAIRSRPHDVPRQLDRAERVFERYSVP